MIERLARRVDELEGRAKPDEIDRDSQDRIDQFATAIANGGK